MGLLDDVANLPDLNSLYNQVMGVGGDGGADDGEGATDTYSGSVGGDTGVKLTYRRDRPDVVSGNGGDNRTGQVLDDVDQIVAAASQKLGKNISKRAIVAFMVKWGADVAGSALGLSKSELYTVLADVKAKPHRRRGPHLNTMVKRIRRADRYKKTLAKYARKAHVHAASSHHFHKRRK